MWTRLVANASRQTGDTVEGDTVIAACVNRFALRTPASVKKLDENKETILQETVSHKFRTAMQLVDDGNKKNQANSPVLSS